MVNTINKLNHCRICHSEKINFIFVKNGYEIVRCEKCKLTFLNFSPNNQFLINYYSKDYFLDDGDKGGYSSYEGERCNLEKSFQKRIEIIKKIKPKGSLLDIGCATGIFLKMAMAFWDCSGVDISPYACDIAKKKGINIFDGRLEESPYKKKKFDVITLWDTIEHLDDPSGTVALISKMTKQNGIIALTTGDVGSFISKIFSNRWHLYNVPQHLTFFDKKTLTNLLNKNGFEVIKICYPKSNFTLNYLVFRFITLYKQKFFFSLYKKFYKSKLFTLNFPINLFDIMLVIAQKS